MRNPFARPGADAGRGSLNDYRYDLIPAKRTTTMRLAGSDPFQAELAEFAGQEVQLFFAKRTIEEERTDAPLPARIFAERRMSGIVGYIPRGLEPVIFEAISRLENAGRLARIPGVVASTRHGLRVDLLMGQTR